jgi:hypothetical protein
VISVAVAPRQAVPAPAPVQTVENEVAGAASTVATVAPLASAGEVARSSLGALDGTMGGNLPA